MRVRMYGGGTRMRACMCRGGAGSVYVRTYVCMYVCREGHLYVHACIEEI